MDWGLAISSSSKPYSLTIGGNGNLRRSKHVINSIHYPSSCITKGSEHKKKTQIEYNVLKLQQPSLGHGYNLSGGGSTYQECNRKYAVKAVHDQPMDFELQKASNPMKILESAKNFLAAFYYFSYPYTMIGITLCAFCSSALAVEKLSDVSLSFLIGVFQAVIPQLFIEIYLSGVNQLYDLEIDKINKPHLPMASGQFSFRTGVIMSAAFLAMSFGFTWLTGSWPLIWNLVVITSSWTAYSIDVPFMRWKRYPLIAAMCMIATWGLALPISFFHHMQTFVLKRPISFPRSLSFLVAFMILYSIGIALSKDIPDVEGDKEHGINSFSVVFGQKRVFWICISLFEMAFGVGVLGGVTSPHLWTKIITGLGNVILGSILWYQAKSFDFSDKVSTGSFYMYIWKLLYAALFLMAFIR